MRFKYSNRDKDTMEFRVKLLERKIEFLENKERYERILKRYKRLGGTSNFILHPATIKGHQVLAPFVLRFNDYDPIETYTERDFNTMYIQPLVDKHLEQCIDNTDTLPRNTEDTAT